MSIEGGVSRILPSAAERTAASLALSQALGPIVTASHISSTAIFHEWFRYLPKDQLALAAGAAFLVTNAIGFYYEVNTLKKEGVTINPLTVLANSKIKSPEIATVAGMIGANILGYCSNPADIASVVSVIVANENVRLFLTDFLSHVGVTLPAYSGSEQLFYSNLICRSVVGFSASLFLNWTIRHGLSRVVLEKSHQVADFATQKALYLVSLAAIISTLYDGTATLDDVIEQLS